MHTFVLQDWITAAGPATGGTPSLYVTQDEIGWLDLAPFQDVVIFLDVRQTTASTTIAFETAPTRDDSLFLPLTASPVTLTVGSTPQVVPAFMLSANTPLARYLRWKVGNGSSIWSATFRVVVAANSPGM